MLAFAFFVFGIFVAGLISGVFELVFLAAGIAILGLLFLLVKKVLEAIIRWIKSI